MSIVIRHSESEPIAVWTRMVNDLSTMVDDLYFTLRPGDTVNLREYFLMKKVYDYASLNGPIHEGPLCIMPCPDRFFEIMFNLFGVDDVLLIWKDLLPEKLAVL
jgi:hypothetical protein